MIKFPIGYSLLVDTVTTTETVCSRLPSSDADEFRSKVKTLVERYQPSKHSNITPEERTALFGLKNDKNITILPADKGNVL